MFGATEVKFLTPKESLLVKLVVRTLPKKEETERYICSSELSLFTPQKLLRNWVYAILEQQNEEV